jgi:hypothetical protein
LIPEAAKLPILDTRAGEARDTRADEVGDTYYKKYTMLTIDELRRQDLIIFECISGSKAYGLDTPSSDVDIRGVFVLPKHLYYNWDRPQQVNNPTNDESYYELDRFVELLYRNNPNLLEMLAVNPQHILQKDPIFDMLSVEMFLSKQAKETFAGYAMTQIRKARGLKKKIVNPMGETRKEILDFCHILDNYGSQPLRTWLNEKGYQQTRCGLVNVPHTKGVFALFYDPTGNFGYSGIMRKAEANEVALSSIPKGENLAAYMYFNTEAYSLYCKEYRQYWEWVENRNESRYENTATHGKNYDAKNMMHTFRLLEVAEEILEYGEIRVLRPNRDELLSIKAGQHEFADLLATAEAKIAKIEALYETCTLPDTPDLALINQVLYDMRQEFYYRR